MKLLFVLIALFAVIMIILAAVGYMTKPDTTFSIYKEVQKDGNKSNVIDWKKVVYMALIAAAVSAVTTYMLRDYVPNSGTGDEYVVIKEPRSLSERSSCSVNEQD